MDLEYWELLTGEAIEEEEVEEEIAYRNIWVVAEAEDGVLTPVSLEMVGKARELANALGAYVQSVLLGEELEDLAQELIQRGADSVYLADDPRLAEYHLETYAQVLGDLFQEQKPEIILFGATELGQELAPRLAQRLGTGLISDCLALSIDETERVLLATHPVYGGEYFHVSAFLGAKPQIATVRPGAFRLPFADEYRYGDVEEVAVNLEGIEGQVKILSTSAEEAQPQTPLSKATVIVAGGRGLGDAEGFALVEELAEVLGGQAAGTRGALDEGWISEEQQVGLSEITVKPDLYIACGISGDVHHYFAMQESKFVVAIHNNPDAPIFKTANLGIVGNPKEVIPPLLAELRAG
ncbi:MAG: electron transfer flavoprotein subunit alpha/FixB family protein [Chloroflexi bacterium]|nr:electron transfer flavoprotein subunit alpha/FixB family protein [Chloroflexota bacterium]